MKRLKLDLRKTSPSLDSVNDEVKLVLSGGSDAIASLTAEKLTGRVGGVSEEVGILRKSSKIFIFLFGLFFVGNLLSPTKVNASVNDFVINSFITSAKLSNKDKQGTLHITEDITVTFSDYNHGIERAIPVKYKGNQLKLHVNNISSDTGTPTSWTSYTSNDNEVLRIGDPSQTITGRQHYKIDYTVNNVISFYNDHDELYWDINGDQWQQQAEYVSATFKLQDGLNVKDAMLKCFTGSYGSTKSNCDITKSNDSRVMAVTTKPLGMSENMSVVIGFEKGYFSPPTLKEKLAERLGLIFGLVILPLVGLLSGFFVWFSRGRDAKGRGVIVPQYTPPKDLTIFEAGAIADFSVDGKDLTALIVDLARKGYIQLIEEKKTKILGKDSLSYQIKLLDTNTDTLNSVEKSILAALFNPYTKDAVVNTGKYLYELNNAYLEKQAETEERLKSQGYLRKLPGLITGLVVFFFLIIILLSGVITNIFKLSDTWAIIVGAIAGFMIYAVFASYFNARTSKGREVYEHLMGLKMYMELAEKDRLELLEGPNAKYAPKTGEPKRTVEFFEKLLPYAILLGVEKQWAEQFKEIYKTPPDWYSGSSNFSSFNAGYLTSSLGSSFTSSMKSTYSAPSSSGSSGFSGGGGGGFSGGGGGGGGGGGW